MEKRVKRELTIAGKISDVGFEKCRTAVQYLKELDGLLEFNILGYFETQWEEYLKCVQDEKKLNFLSHKKSPLVFIETTHRQLPPQETAEEWNEFVTETEYIGGAPEFLEWAGLKYGYHDNTKDFVYNRKCNANLRKLINQNPDRKYAYMNIQINKDLPMKVIFQLYNDLAPLTTNNFLTLCKGDLFNTDNQPLSYVDSSIHRIVSRAYLQGGNIKIEGEKSIYEGEFADESFATTHDHIGILGMAKKSGRSHTNECQFYVTLAAPLSYLDKKFVGFGRVIQGYRAFKIMEKLETLNQKPVDIITIVSAGEYIFGEEEKKQGVKKPIVKKPIAKKEAKDLLLGSDFTQMEGEILHKLIKEFESIEKYKKTGEMASDTLRDFDKNEDNFLDHSELKAFIDSLLSKIESISVKFKINENVVYDFLQIYDRDKNKKLDADELTYFFEDFVRFFKSRLAAEKKRRELQKKKDAGQSEKFELSMDFTHVEQDLIFALIEEFQSIERNEKIPEMAKETLQDFDKDKDKFLDNSEVKTFLESYFDKCKMIAVELTFPQNIVDIFLDKYDIDKNRKLDVSEITCFLEDFLSYFKSRLVAEKKRRELLEKKKLNREEKFELNMNFSKVDDNLLPVLIEEFERLEEYKKTPEMAKESLSSFDENDDDYLDCKEIKKFLDSFFKKLKRVEVEFTIPQNVVDSFLVLYDKDKNKKLDATELTAFFDEFVNYFKERLVDEQRKRKGEQVKVQEEEKKIEKKDLSKLQTKVTTQIPLDLSEIPSDFLEMIFPMIVMLEAEGVDKMVESSFKQFDVNNDGFLDLSELQKMLNHSIDEVMRQTQSKNKMEITQTYIDEFMTAFDQDLNKKLDKKEMEVCFSKFITHLIQTFKKEIRLRYDPSYKKKQVTKAPVQAGGHPDVIRFEKDGTLLKFMRAERDEEAQFYEAIKDSAPLNEFCPKYLGQIKEGENLYIRMENIYFELTQPGYIDIKLGENYHDHESAEAIASKIKKQEKSTRRELAFCVCGSTHYHADGTRSEFDLRAKPIKPIWKPMLNDFLITFLKSSGRSEMNMNALEFYINKMKQILAYVDGGSNPWYFISASMFLVLSNTEDKYNLKMIDFGKVRELKDFDKPKDTRFIQGLTNVLQWFEEVRDLQKPKIK